MVVDVHELLRRAAADGLALSLEAGGLAVRGDREMRARWRAVLAEHKTSVMAALAVDARREPCHASWLMHFADRNPATVTFAPAVDHAGALSACPDAIAAEPMPEPAAAPISADLLALFDECERAGLYDEADRAALPAMLGTDSQATRQLIEAMHSGIRRCRDCRHFRRPGQSFGYCTGRDDLPPAYGLLYELFDDRVVRCDAFDDSRGQ